MKPNADLTILCSGPRVRRALESVLAPDNEGGPRGLRISVEGRGSAIRISIASATTATAISTVLAFLRDVGLFQEVWLLSSPKDARGIGA